MKVAFFNTKDYDRIFFERLNTSHQHVIEYFDFHLNSHSASIINGHEVVCAFINDSLDADTIATLEKKGVKLIALRSAGFNHVDLQAAEKSGIPVVRVPAYSPAAVAEHTASLLLALNRKLHKAYNRVKEGNFSIDGLMGFDLQNRTVGVIGTGQIGLHFAKIMRGFGCDILAYDPYPQANEQGVTYVTCDQLLKQAQIISLHCPLTPQTHHLLNDKAFQQMQDGVVILNTSRGKLIDTRALIKALKTGKIRALGLDVYEEEESLFFEDFSDKIILDDTFARLLTFPNVLITSHQAFLTEEALENIADTTLNNISSFARGEVLKNQVQ